MIKLDGINKRLDNFQIKDINLQIKPGEYFVILGPTGTGKSVLLEIIAGLLLPEKGEVWFGKQMITGLAPEERMIGMVYQDYMLFPHLNVKDNILFGLRVRKLRTAEQENRLAEIVSLLEIDHLLNRSIKTLSGGEQQRVALARALIIAPEILLLDEPLSALDPNTKEKLQQDLNRIHTRLGTTTIHVTHDFNEALTLADRVAIMDSGRIVQVGTLEEVFQQPKSQFIAEFVGSKNILQGEIINEDSEKMVRVNNELTLEVTSEESGEVKLIIRPEDIIISRQPFTSSARNCYLGTIAGLQRRLSVVEVKVDIGVELIVYITYRSLEELRLKEGEEVYLTFKATAGHVIGTGDKSA